jgi:pimeloyl-ACP methyl ester carboxylesterase
MSLESCFVDANGNRLHLLSAGKGDGRDVLFVHGNSHCAGVWAPLMQSLASRGHRCFSLDLRGHGRSDKPAGGYAWEDLRDDVAAVLDALGFERALIVAHSRGGGASLLATAYHPGRVAGVIAFEPTTPMSRAAPPGSTEPPPALRMAQRATERRRTHFPGRDYLFDYYRQRDQFKDWQPEYLRALIEYGFEDVDGGIERLCPGWVEGKLFEAMLDDTPWREASPSDIPVHIVYGQNSGRLGPGRDPGAPVRRIFPAHQTTVMPDATHFGPMEHPAEFERLVVSFERTLD